MRWRQGGVKKSIRQRGWLVEQRETGMCVGAQSEKGRFLGKQRATTHKEKVRIA